MPGATVDTLYDSYFGITTEREDGDDAVQGEHDNIYEVTSYFFLERLFQTFPFSKEDHIIDFGCGKGRVLFMASHYSCRYATGYENNKARFDVLQGNIQKYQQKHGTQTYFDVYNADAQSAVINDTANKFFFFEPFHLILYKQVVQNIIKSLEKNPRDVTFFLYLPHKDTLEYFDSLKMFNKEIHVDSTLYYVNEELVTMPQFAFYSNYSMADSVDPNFLLY